MIRFAYSKTKKEKLLTKIIRKDECELLSSKV